MRLTALTVEGTPREISELRELRALLMSMTNSGSTLQSGDQNGEAVLPPSIEEFCRDRGRSNPDLRLVLGFVERCLKFGHVEAEPGHSTRSADGLGTYLMLRRVMGKYGAFVYLNPSSGGATLRLREEGAPGMKFGHRNAQKGEYQIRIRLTSEGALDEAVALARLAFDRVAA